MAFWCRRCGGRVLEDESYTDSNGLKMAVLTCILCSRNYQCPQKDYDHLVQNMDAILYERKTGKTLTKKIISQRKHSR